jgi:hypothetical protein
VNTDLGDPASPPSTPSPNSLGAESEIKAISASIARGVSFSNTQHFTAKRRAIRAALIAIAANVGCDVKTLKRHFKNELADGHAQVEAAMGAAIVRAGLGGNVYAARFWLATHGGPKWRISEKRKITGTIDLQQMSLEDLARELATLRAKQALGGNKEQEEPSRSVH